MLDVIMLTFGEPEADENFEILKQKAPHAQRVDNVVGLLEAHKAAAELSKTNYFYVCDADAIIQENFQFKFEPSDRREAYPGVQKQNAYLLIVVITLLTISYMDLVR